jgi:hypothetical protein
MTMFIYIEQYIFSIKENMMCQDNNGKFNYRIKFKFNLKIYIKIMRCKIVRSQNYVAQYYKVNQKSKKFWFYIIV